MAGELYISVGGVDASQVDTDLMSRLKLRTGETDEELLMDYILSAKSAINSRRFPYHDWPVDDNGNTYVEERYRDLQMRIALDLYNKAGAEGETSHSENGISRGYESSWISEQLLSEVTPLARI